MPYQTIPYHLEQKLERKLDAEESVKWKGVPVPRLFKLESIILFLFAIPWTAFSIFWIFAAAGFGMPDLSGGFKPELVFPLFGIPFVLIGFGMMSAPIWSYLHDKSIIYAVTDKRVIIISGSRNVKTLSMAAENIKQITTNERGETGDLIFGHNLWENARQKRKVYEPGFYNIQNADEAHRAIKELLEAYDEQQNQTGNDWRLKN